MKVSPIFTETLRDLRCGVRRIRHQGGMAAGKTVNILAALATLASEDGPGVTTVTSMSFPHLKGGALRDFEMYVYPSFKSSIKKYHRTDHIFTFKSGHIIEFKVFDNEFAARGPRRKRLFVNEVNKYDYMTYWQLDQRSEQTIIDYNPTIRFWAHEKLEGDPDTKSYITNHTDNPFLSEQKHREIEDFCIFKYDKDGNKIKVNGKPVIERGNYELWKVYARGLTGNVTGLIFPNWECIDDNDFPKTNEQDWIWSIDFGYTNDPTAIVKICKVANTLFIKELAYEAGLKPLQIKQILVANGHRLGRDPLYCEHDPDMVRALRNIGVNAFLARKGQGSINAGIELFNTYDVKYPSSSKNIGIERSLYIWEEDEFGKSTNIPVDRNNHLMDACRYGVYSHFLRNTLK
jgi:phage terminase large subunit